MPSPNAGSARPPESASSVAHAFATRAGLRPGSTCTLVPSLILLGARRREREAEHGSGAGPLMRSDSQSESKPWCSSASASAPSASPVERAEVAEPVADPDLHCLEARRAEVRVLAELAAGDLAHVHLVGPVDEVQRARVRVHRRRAASRR